MFRLNSPGRNLIPKCAKFPSPRERFDESPNRRLRRAGGPAGAFGAGTFTRKAEPSRNRQPFSRCAGILSRLPDVTGATSTMPDAQLTNQLSPRETQRPRCPQCQSRIRIQSVARGRPGFEHWTLRCIKCGLIYDAQVPADPLKSQAMGWFDGELGSPDANQR